MSFMSLDFLFIPIAILLTLALLSLGKKIKLNKLNLKKNI